MPDSDPQPSINTWRRQADQFRGQLVLNDQLVRRLNACISEFLGLLQDVAKLHEADYLKTFHMLKILNARFRRAGLLMCCLLAWLPTMSQARALPEDCRSEQSFRSIQASTEKLSAALHWHTFDSLLLPEKALPESLRGRMAQVRFVLRASELRADSNKLQFKEWVLSLKQSKMVPVGDKAYLGESYELSLPDDASLKDRAAIRQRLREDLVVIAYDLQDKVQWQSRIQIASLLDRLYAEAARSQPLGLSVAGSATMPQPSLRLWAPTAISVWLCIGEHEPLLLPMKRIDHLGIWHIDLEKRPEPAWFGTPYHYLVEVWTASHGLVINKVTDPYALDLTANSKQSRIVWLDNPRTKPKGWDKARRPQAVSAQTQMLIYELHLRDFSVADDKVPAKLRGKYLAALSKDSWGMQHLRRLAQAGISDLHLLPVFDFATVPEDACTSTAVKAAYPADPTPQALISNDASTDCFNWGYDPLHFQVPEGSYALNPDKAGSRIREFRTFVQAMHRIGLRVGMDVVYNHMSASGQHPQSVLDRIVPGYYHRLNATGEVERSTCCDNTATEHAMMAKLMQDSLITWAKDYRIDSFRFDLMGHQPKATMLAIQEALQAIAKRPVPFIGEGWNFGEVANHQRFEQASQLALAGSGIASFSDRARDALRGGSAGDASQALLDNAGFLHGRSNPEIRSWLLCGLAGSLSDFELLQWRTLAEPSLERSPRSLRDIDYKGQPCGYVAEPGEVVNYVENHDNHTLFDINVYRLPASASPDDRLRAQVLGFAINSLSQGIAYFHAGGELMRSKSMDRNSFDSGDWFNRIDWSGKSHAFGSGLPPAAENGKDYASMLPLLNQPLVRPKPEHIARSLRSFLDWVHIRRSIPELRLESAKAVQKQLKFLDFDILGQTQRAFDPSKSQLLIAAHIAANRDNHQTHSKAKLDSPTYRGIAFMVNGSFETQRIRINALKGRTLSLHPRLKASAASEPRDTDRPAWDAKRGVLTIPRQSALLFFDKD